MSTKPKEAPQTKKTGNVITPVQFVRGEADKQAFEKEFAGTGGAIDKIVRFLSRQADTDRRIRSTVVNMIALPAMRAVVMTWPQHAEASDMRKLVKEQVFDNTEAGKLLNAQIDQYTEENKTTKGEDELKLSALRSKRSFIVGKMVEARNAAAKVIEAENNGWHVAMTHGSPDVLVMHESAPLKIRKMTAGAIANVKSFVGVTDTKKLAVRGVGDGNAKTYRNGTAALPDIKALSGALAKWAGDPKKFGVTAAVTAELSTLVMAAAELLNVPLNAAQTSTLEGLSNTDTASPDVAKTGTDD